MISPLYANMIRHPRVDDLTFPIQVRSSLLNAFTDSIPCNVRLVVVPRHFAGERSARGSRSASCVMSRVIRKSRGETRDESQARLESSEFPAPR